MMLVKVTNGSIEHDKKKYDIGEAFHVSEKTAENFERLGVAKIIGMPVAEPEAATGVAEPEAATEVAEPEAPVMTVDNSTFEKKQSKKGKRKR